MGEMAGVMITNAWLTPSVLISLKSSLWVWPAKLATTVSWNVSSNPSNRAVHSGTHMGTIALAQDSLAEGAVASDRVARFWMVVKPSIPGGMWNISHVF